MHMAARAAAWVAWAEWTCNTPQRVFGQKRAGFGPLFFLTCIRAGLMRVIGGITALQFPPEGPSHSAALDEYFSVRVLVDGSMDRLRIGPIGDDLSRKLDLLGEFAKGNVSAAVPKCVRRSGRWQLAIG
jgi:hypothetical protein